MRAMNGTMRRFGRKLGLGIVLACASGGVSTAAATGSPSPAPADSVPEQVLVKAKRLLQKEKNSPSAVTELGKSQISQEGVMGSTSTLLRQAPSIYLYQSGPGENSPVFSIRGTRSLEVAATLDDVPMQDLLNGGSNSYLGNRFTLDQIGGVTIYPGVAYPDKNTFGTIGGTLAYTSKRPEANFSLDLTGSVGSFNTHESGFALNSGRLDGPLGSGDSAPKFLLSYSNLQSGGYIQYTPAHYNTMEFAFDKPYDDGLSKFSSTVLFNTASGALQGAPTPTPLPDVAGRFANYPTDQLYQREQTQYLTAYIKNDTYISDEVDAGFSLFYRNSTVDSENYEAPDVAYNGSPVNTYPFINIPYNLYSNSNFGIGHGYFWAPGYLNYDPAKFYNNPKYCPPDQLGQNDAACGLNAQATYARTDSYGFQPHVTLLLPFNTIKLGGLIAKETAPTPETFIWGTPNIPKIPGVNQFQTTGYGGGSQRTIYQIYAQDKVDLLSDTLHVTPGVTLEATSSSNQASDFFETVCSDAACDSATVSSVNYKYTKFDREALPFFNMSYDLDKVLPAIAGTSLYASYGNSVLFAPTTDYGPTTNGGVPYPSIVHMYEAGIKYDTSSLLLSADYFYQKVDRDFGYYEGSGPTTGQNFYGNSGQREFKGVEAAITWQATPDVQLFANGSHVLATYLVTQPAFSTIGEDQYGLAIKGAPISGVPAFLANYGVDFHRKNLLLDDDAFSARFSGQFTGSQYTTYDLSIYQVVPPYPTSQTQGDTVTNPNGKLSAFSVYNLLLSYSLPLPYVHVRKATFDLNIQNLFNKHYWQYYYSQIPPQQGIYAGGAYEDGLPGEPFSVTFTTMLRF
jgi:iron complex outermembrane receptor protein